MSYWQELVQSVCKECTFAPPASEDVLAEVEQALGVSVPEELLALWREANGVTDEYSRGIWSAEETIRQNLELRSYPEQNDLYMPFDPLFCFAAAGNGDLFFFPIQAGGVNWPWVFEWDHETDSRVNTGNNLEQFVRQWYTGQMQG